MSEICIRQLPGLQLYLNAWQQMQDFTNERTENSLDEIWLLEHQPIFTQGQAGKAEHLLNPGDIEVFQADRGGQVTYHGPGQLVVYLLINLRRKHLGVRQMVDIMEQSLIELLQSYGVKAYAKPDAPGVYVDQAKIASLGLRVRRGCCFHGLALNVDMELEPFSRINPCGYQGMAMTQLADLVSEPVDFNDIMQTLVDTLIKKIGYNSVLYKNTLE